MSLVVENRPHSVLYTGVMAGGSRFSTTLEHFFDYRPKTVASTSFEPYHTTSTPSREEALDHDWRTCNQSLVKFENCMLFHR